MISIHIYVPINHKELPSLTYYKLIRHAGGNYHAGIPIYLTHQDQATIFVWG